MLSREKTKRMYIGSTPIGGQKRILIQSMCNIKTSDYIRVSEQINRCAALGADLMRVSVLDFDDAAAVKEIKKRITIPLIADIHFDYRLAIKCIENGIDAIRLNPGNIQSKEGIKEVTRLAKEKHIPIRIGVNAGSIDKNINNTTDIVQAKELVESAKKMVKILEDEGFYDIVISLKCSHVLQTISAYELASQEFDYPLHIGITEAGPKDVGLIRSVAGIAPLLLKGIGDTIRISLSDEPEEEIKACKRLLKDLELNNDYPLLISCPTCGRTQVDLVPLANKVLKFLEDNKINKTVAIMGCIVNGLGRPHQKTAHINAGFHGMLLPANIEQIHQAAHNHKCQHALQENLGRQ